MTAADAYMRQLINRFEVDCLNRRSQVMRSTSIAEMRRAADVSVPALVRPYLSAISEYAALQREAEERAGQIVREQLEVLKRVAKSEFGEGVAAFKKDVLGELRGEYAAQFRLAERDLERLVAYRESPLNPD